MAGIQIDGLISNINTTDVINALLTAAKAPAVRLGQRRDDTTKKLTAVQGLSGSVLGIRVAADSLANVENFRGRAATSTNQDLVAVTATSKSEPGSFTVSIQKIAKATQISSDASNAFASADTALGLDGQIRVGNRTVAIRATDTLKNVAARLSNAGAGISASVVEASPGQFRLSIRALQTGADTIALANAGTTNVLEGLRLVQPSSDAIANSITNGAASSKFNVHVQPVAGLLNIQSNVPSGTVAIGNVAGSINVGINLATQSLDDIASSINSAATTAGSSISATVHEVTQGVFQLEITSGDSTTPTFTDAGNVLETLGVVRSAFAQVDQAGQNALFKVNGIDIVRTTNTVSDVVSGVTFNLLSDATPASAATVTVQSDDQQATSTIQSFVSAYNSAKGFIDKFASYDPETQRAGILLGDSAVLNVESSLSGLLFRSISTLPSQQLASLNSGAGVSSGSITVTDKAGGAATIDLTNTQNVQGVLDALNHNANIKIEATINQAGTGIDIRDKSGGLGTLTIAEAGGGTTAANLGILGSTSGGKITGKAVATREFITLAQLGVTANTDGSLAFDSSKFQAYNRDHASAVEAFFTQPKGFGAQARDTLDSLTNSKSGALSVRATSLQESIDSYNETIKGINNRVSLEETRLRAQFSAMEHSLSQLQQQGSYLLAQLGQISSSSSSGRK
jgi:flagellar hook-associated protein 2